MTLLNVERLRSTRAWIVAGVLAIGAVAWLAVAAASGVYLEYSGYLGVVAIGLVLGSVEVSYLLWLNWGLGQRSAAAAAAGGAAGGSILVFASTFSGVTAHGFVTVASGIGLLGLSTAIGLLGLYKATGKSTAGTMTALVVTLTLAYFASVLWAAVP